MKYVITLLALSMSFFAQAQVPVNIVYPIDGEAYPVVSPGAHAEYFASSFGATCPGGPYIATWGFDNTTQGKARFYDEISVQFTHKLPSGTHSFWVEIPKCGRDLVKFEIK